MKKLLILIVIALISILTVITILNGLEIGGLSILAITGIKEESLELDETVQNATKLASTTYPQKNLEINDNIKKLQSEKQKYEDMVTVSTDSQVQLASQYEKYNVETLWAKIGKHATNEGVIMQMDIVKGSNNTQNTYNLNFTLTGTYIGITDFITDIEDDSTLGFKIESFKMEPNTEDTLKATFSCKDISIEGISSTTTITNENTDSTGETNNDNTSNNANTTNGTNTTNTTNTTNKNTNTNTTNTANTTNSAS